MRTQENICYFSIAKDLSRTSSVTIDTLANGEVALFTPEGTLVTTSNLATTTEFVIAQGRSTGVPLISPVIKKSTLSANVKAYTAPTNQVTFIGYNGTSGDIVDIDDNNYLVRFYFNDIDAQGFNQQRVKHFEYTSGNLTTGDSSEVAIGITASIINNFKREKYGRTADGQNEVLARAVCNVAASATNDFTNAVTVVKGSKTFSVATALTYNGTSGTLAVGDFVRFATAPAGTLALTDDCYKVVSISGLNVTVDRPIQVTGGSFTDAADDTQVIPAADAASASWGVRLEGNERKWEVGRSTFTKVRFDVSLLNFGSTIITTTQNASEGVGSYKTVSELEQFLQGNEFSYLYRSNPGGPLLATPYNDAVSGITYDFISLKFYEDVQTGFGAPNRMLKEMVIALDNTTAPNAQIEDSTSGVIVLIDDILGTNLQASLT